MDIAVTIGIHVIRAIARRRFRDGTGCRSGTVARRLIARYCAPIRIVIAAIKIIPPIIALAGPIAGPVNYFNLVYRRARMEGFIVMDFASRFPEAIEVLVKHLGSGELRHRETVLQGFEQLPQALMNLFSGANIGKQLVAVNE